MKVPRYLTLSLVLTLLAGSASQALAEVKPAAGKITKAKAVSVELAPAVVEKAKVHKLRPELFAAISPKDEQTRLSGPTLLKAPKLKVAPIKPKLDVAQFGESLHGVFKDKVRGYALQVRKGGTPVYTLIWDTARSANEGAKGWTLDTKMHVASVGKLITAITAVKMLDERGLSFDTKVGPYIPTYWTVGANSADITFKELLTHTAGFTAAHAGGDFGSFKSQIAAGVAANPVGLYTNGSFSLVRVLNATMTGAVPANYQIPFNVNASLKDSIWDILTTDAFFAYAKAKVLNPSGVTGVSTTASSSSALAYSTKSDNQGWNSGDLATQLGGCGFRVSVNDLLDIMGTFRRKGTIVSPAKAQAALDASLGIDVIEETPAGKIYFKNGWWGSNLEGSFYHVEQAVVFFLPEDMEVAVLVNSNIGNDMSLAGTVKNAYLGNLK